MSRQRVSAPASNASVADALAAALARHGIAVVMTVLNNQVLGYQKHAEDTLYGDHTSAVDFTPVDHAAIARACGLEGIRIEAPEDYAAALETSASSGTTTLIDVITDPAAYPPITLFDGRLTPT